MSSELAEKDYSGTCPHGDKTCPCPDDDPCHYEGSDSMICPNPVLGFKGLTFSHCHVEGCDWHVRNDSGGISGECGLLKLGIPPAGYHDGEPIWSMAQSQPDRPAWACGWIRTPLNLASKENADA